MTAWTRKARRLAEHLAANHLAFDLPRHDWADIADLHPPSAAEPRRVIVVVGAGASADAGLPTAVPAREQLFERLRSSTGNARFDDDFKDELRRLTMVYRLDAEAFETVLLALSALVRPADRLRSALQEMYSVRYRPLLCYEVIAHLMKHRFVDAVINFNFDELLDQSIEDELDANEYYRVLSDGDSPPANPYGRPYNRPVYLKLHGTVSHPSTLRFTREAYFGAPAQIADVVRHLLTDAPITVLAIGFGMQSFEFNALLNEVPYPSDLFLLNLVEVQPEPALGPNWKLTLLPIQPNRGLDDAVVRIWNSVESIFKEGFKPRSIARHCLINAIFGPGAPADPRRGSEATYLRRRAVVEAALTTAKGKGIVNMGVISSDRCGVYHERHRAKDAAALPLVHLCRKLGLKEFGYMHDIFRYQPIADDGYGVVPTDRFNFDKLADVVFTELGLPGHTSEHALLVETLESLYRGKEVEMRTTLDPVYRAVFGDPKPISTGASFVFHTREILSSDEWTILLVSAETGEWLLEKKMASLVREHGRDAKIFLLLADPTYVPQLFDIYEGRVHLFVRTLPWWQHNRHMTVTATRHAPVESIYFTRRLRSPTINPVRLGMSDTALIAEAFYTYWLKASRPTDKWLRSEDWGWANLMEMLESDHGSRVYGSSAANALHPGA